MRGRTKLVSLATVLAVILTVSMVFASGLMRVSSVSLFSGPLNELGSSGTPDVFFDPAEISGDYVNDAGFEIGEPVYFGVNMSDVTDLFCYQINVTWTPGILNFTGIESYGDLLNREGLPYGTSRIEDFAVGSNVTGYAAIAESILGDVEGVTSVTGGQLFNMSFVIAGYGWTEINVGLSGRLNTTLLDSAGAEILSFTWTVGWFDNRIRGDSDGNHVVTISDMGEVSDRWTSPPGIKPYARYVDWDNNGLITISDMGVVSDNWGRTAP